MSDTNFETEEDEGAGFEEATEGEAFVVDMSGVEEDSGFKPLPRGIYPCTVDDVEFGPSSKGNMMFSYVLEIEEGHEYAGRKFFYHTTFTPKDIGRTKRVLARLGRADLANSPALNPQEVADNGELVGLRCRVKVKIGAYQGEKKNEVQDVLPAEPDGVDEDAIV